MSKTVVEIISLSAILISLFLVFTQTRKLEKQVTIANLFSRYEALNHASVRYDNALSLIFARPTLRPYFFGRKPLDLTGDDLARALTVADLMAGAVDYALRVGDRFPDGAESGWKTVALEMANQPLIQAVVREQPHHFPDLMPYLTAAQVEAPATR